MTVGSLQTLKGRRSLLRSLKGPKATLRDRVLTNDAPWYPLPGPQLHAYLCAADELFYGGAAGGGKTDLAIGLAVTAHRRSLILRRESTQLRGIIERSREIIGDRGRLNENTGIWRLDDGRTIELSGCQLERDKRKFQGRPHDLLVFDEATEFLESQADFIAGWVRTEDPEQRVRILYTGNPPTTAEGRWIVEKFGPWLDDKHPNPAAPGELRWFAMVDDEEVECESGEPFWHNGELIIPKSRTFIPAHVTDNPYYMATGYVAQLQALPEPLRSQMLYGDFSVGLDDDPWQVIPTSWARAAQARWTPDGKPATALTALGCDPARGGKDKTALVKRWGPWFSEPLTWPGSATQDGPTVAALIVSNHEGDAVINLDVIGIGASVYDALVSQGVSVNAVNFAEGSNATDKSGRFAMRNVRAAAWWAMREALDPQSGQAVAIPPGGEILADLTAPRWKLSTSGILIESKDDIKERLGRSPDIGDAIVLANYQDVTWWID
jgi:hypothetical protein